MTVRTAICVLVVAGSAVWAQTPAATIKDVQKQVKGNTSTTEKNRQNQAKPTPTSAGKQPSTAAATTKAPAKGVSSKTPAPTAQPTAAKTATQKGTKPQEKKTAKASSAAAQPKASTPKTAEVPKDAPAQPTEKDQKAESTEPESTPESPEQQAAASMRGRRDPFQTVIRPEAVSHCSTGKKCLVVDKMDLKGIVRSQNGMIAIVENQQKKTYFLHENDPIFNGHVVKINPDSVLFRETVTDRIGKQSTRDVVKRITGPSV